ncbi:MAG: hypothetical protein AVDCRST_MAG17-1510, partial [uncultured Solirubrobacterales bacterium]
ERRAAPPGGGRSRRPRAPLRHRPGQLQAARSPARGDRRVDRAGRVSGLPAHSAGGEARCPGTASRPPAAVPADPRARGGHRYLAGGDRRPLAAAGGRQRIDRRSHGRAHRSRRRRLEPRDLAHARRARRRAGLGAADHARSRPRRRRPRSHPSRAAAPLRALPAGSLPL